MTDDAGHFATIGGERQRIVSGTISSALSDRSSCTFTVDLNHLAAVDLTPPIQILSDDPTDSEDTSLPRFTGHALTAEPNEGLLEITAEGALELVESHAGFIRTSGVSPQETIYLVARQGGFPHERLEISGLEEVPLEMFLVEVPLSGLAVERTVTAAGIEFLPLADPNDGLEFGPFTQDIDDITGQWGRPTARARAYEPGRLMYEAERQAIERIEHALIALLATSAYGLSRDPWGRDLAYDRSRARARPSSLPIVFTQGIASGRRWLHALAGEAISTELQLGISYARWEEILSGRPSDELARSVRALRDAADEGRDTFDRCHAFCTVLEYYTSSSRPPAVVSKAARRNALRAIDAIDMTSVERDRLRAVVGQVNSPPLMARVRHQATEDGAPLSDPEWNLISKLRRARNDTVHGRGGPADTPSTDDIRWGVSIASRLLLYRWAQEATDRKS